MNWTTIKMSELMRNKTLRMDPKYWIKKKAASSKLQAASAIKGTHSKGKILKVESK